MSGRQLSELFGGYVVGDLGMSHLVDGLRCAMVWRVVVDFGLGSGDRLRMMVMSLM